MTLVGHGHGSDTKALEREPMLNFEVSGAQKVLGGEEGVSWK